MVAHDQMDTAQGPILNSSRLNQPRASHSAFPQAQPSSSSACGRSKCSSMNHNIQSVPSNGDSTSPSHARQSCQCLQMALKIDEQLKTYTSAKGSRSIIGSGTVRKLDEDLSRALAQCSTTMDCKACSVQSSVMMLILSICEKMLASFEQLCNAYLAPRAPESRRPYSSDSRVSIGTLSSVNTDDSKGLKMGDYMLDTDDEVYVVRTLVISRMKSLGSLLFRLEKIISSNGWTGHGEIFDSIHCSYRRTAATIKKLEV